MRSGRGAVALDRCYGCGRRRKALTCGAGSSAAGLARMREGGGRVNGCLAELGRPRKENGRRGRKGGEWAVGELGQQAEMRERRE